MEFFKRNNLYLLSMVLGDSLLINAVAMYAAASVPRIKKVLISVVSILAPRNLHITKVEKASIPIPMKTKVCFRILWT